MQLEMHGDACSLIGLAMQPPNKCSKTNLSTDRLCAVNILALQTSGLLEESSPNLYV